MTLPFFRAAATAGALVLPGLAGAVPTELIVNGDFEAGATGFSTDLTENDSSTHFAGDYAVVTDATTLNGAFTSQGDHTTGSGNMMAINGTTTSGTLSWGQSVNVIAGTTYDLSFWVMSLFGGGSTVLGIVFDGTQVATADNAGTASGVWREFTESWTATGTGAIDVELVELSTGFLGNDYALDDISLTFTSSGSTVIPLPASGLLLLGGLAGLMGLKRRRKV